MKTLTEYWKAQWNELKIELAKDKILYGFVLTTVFIFVGLALWGQREVTLTYNAWNYLESLISASFMMFLSWSIYYYLHLLRHLTPHPLVKFAKTLFTFFTSLSKGGSFIFLLLSLNIVFSSYSYFKSIIPDINPFKYDALFFSIDQWLHFGNSPWEITHAIFSTPLASWIINFLYHLWFLIMWGITSYFLLVKKNLLIRSQYLISFMFCWLLLGSVIATIFSAAGPCYLHLLDPLSQQYIPLIERLNDQNSQLLTSGFPPLWAIDVQDNLWLEYTQRHSGVGSGISAMPSMHVSMSVLMACASYQINKKLGYMLWLFTLAIQIGSVHLGWHYAIDGYTSLILTVIIWKCVGFLVRKHYQTIARVPEKSSCH